MLRTARLFVLAASLPLFAACAAGSAEEQGSTDSAISGTVAEGTVVEVIDDLRIRRTPKKDSSKNVLGLLPTGTKVRIDTATPTDGFYQVTVLDDALTKKLQQKNGWVFGEYLKGEAKDPEPTVLANDDAAPEEDEAATPTPTPIPAARREIKANFVSANCRPMRDNANELMVPTIDDFVINAGKKVPHAALGIDSSEFPVGTFLHIPEVDAEPGVKNAGRSVLFKVVKTGAGSPVVPTVTLCSMASGLLPAKGQQVTLRIVE